MIYRLLADGLLLLHLAFILFVVLGGFLAWRHPRLAWLHLPCAAWGACVEFAGWDCPLTPLENHPWDAQFKPGFRRQAGEVIKQVRGEPAGVVSLCEARETMELIHRIYLA